MYITKVKSLLIVTLGLVISNVISAPAYAKDSTSTSYPFSYPTRPNEQWRFITVVKDSKWTKLTTVQGQPTKGTYLRKGDSLFYGESGGKKASISFGVGLGVKFANVSANVSFSVPLGKAHSSYFGKALKANKSGYYLIKAKKNIKPTIVFIQYRHKKNNKWGTWEKASFYSKDYKVIQSYSTLVKQ